MELKIYKRGQGYYTRLYSALISFAIAAVGCFVLYRQLQGMGNIWVESLVPIGLCVGFGWFFYWLVNKPSIADFLIAAEGEIKKVNWSSRKEIIASTIVVICVVTLMACMLYFADLGFQFLFREVFRIYG